MNSKHESARVCLMLSAMAIFIALAVSMSAQVKTDTSTTSGAATKEVSVERGGRLVRDINYRPRLVSIRTDQQRHIVLLP